MHTYELGAVERSFLRQSMDFRGGQRVFLGLRLKGPHVTALVVEKLPMALLMAQIKHPVLRCVAVQSKNKGLVWCESTRRIDIARFDHRTWEDVFQQRSSLPFNQGELPMKGRGERAIQGAQPNAAQHLFLPAAPTTLTLCCKPSMPSTTEAASRSSCTTL